MKRIFLSAFFVIGMLAVHAQSFEFDMTRVQPRYDEGRGYGWDMPDYAQVPTPREQQGTLSGAAYFSVQVPDGNYRVTVTLGSSRKAACTVVRAESRRLLVEATPTRKGQFRTYTFVVSKRSPYISEKMSVRLKDREKDYLNWDDRLTLEFNGPAPAVKNIRIEKDNEAVTVFLCGNSTVVDQNREPWASWGQMIPRWFNREVAISNHAESGLTAGSFLASNRLDKVLAMMKKGDYVFCEFGHNDQKEKGAGAGAWYNFSYNLKKFVDRVRANGGHVVFVTPTQRRRFEQGKIVETHGDYPDAMRAVARREGVPVIELHDMTRTFFETLGEEDSKRALVHYPANTFPGQEKELADNTHFNQYGAYEISKMVVMGMKELGLPIVAGLRSDWKDFSPASPDDWKTYRWYDSPVYEMVKPDGN